MSEGLNDGLLKVEQWLEGNNADERVNCKRRRITEFGGIREQPSAQSGSGRAERAAGLCVAETSSRPPVCSPPGDLKGLEQVCGLGCVRIQHGS
ncbi:hypothetical protein MHYP_G00063680 [Metynnis hypsauchen]